MPIITESTTVTVDAADLRTLLTRRIQELYPLFDIESINFNCDCSHSYSADSRLDHEGKGFTGVTIKLRMKDAVVTL